MQQQQQQQQQHDDYCQEMLTVLNVMLNNTFQAQYECTRCFSMMWSRQMEWLHILPALQETITSTSETGNGDLLLLVPSTADERRTTKKLASLSIDLSKMNVKVMNVRAHDIHDIRFAIGQARLVIITNADSMTDEVLDCIHQIRQLCLSVLVMSLMSSLTCRHRPDYCVQLLQTLGPMVPTNLARNNIKPEFLETYVRTHFWKPYLDN